MNGKPTKGHIANATAIKIKALYEQKRFHEDGFRVKDFQKRGIALNRTLERLESGRLTLNGAANFLDALGYELEIKIVEK